MSPSDASPSEMPGFPFPGRPGGEHDEPLLDMILGRRALPPDAPPEIHDLARMLAALSGEAEPGELAAEPRVRAVFAQFGPSSRAPSRVSHPVRRAARHRRRRWSPRPARPGLGLAAALVTAVAGLVIFAAYSGVLPGPVQRLAHVTVAAPAPRGSVPHVSTTLDTGRNTRHRTRSSAPSASTRPTHTGHPAATGAVSTPAPHFSPESTPSPGRHTPAQDCTTDPWWQYQPGSEPGSAGAQPSGKLPPQCQGPDGKTPKLPLAPLYRH
jgi:hypothetical protein